MVFVACGEVYPACGEVLVAAHVHERGSREVLVAVGKFEATENGKVLVADDGKPESENDKTVVHGNCKQPKSHGRFWSHLFESVGLTGRFWSRVGRFWSRIRAIA